MENQTNNKTQGWISFRVKTQEYEQIHRNFSSNTCRKLSDYARKILMNKPVVVKYRNHSADEFLSAMIPLKNELNAIGNNFNQAVKKLHTLNQISEFKTWLISYDADKELLLKKVDEIKAQRRKQRVANAIDLALPKRSSQSLLEFITAVQKICKWC